MLQNHLIVFNQLFQQKVKQKCEAKLIICEKRSKRYLKTAKMMEPPQTGKVLRAPSLKRGRAEDSERFQLEHVMGVTVSNNSALSSDRNNHLVAYPSGCAIVLYNSELCKQQSHIVNTCRKTITSLAFSSDGRYLVTGECGHLPSVRIWDLQDTSSSPSGTQVAEFQGHQYGVNSVAFSPSNKYVVSIGSQHDMIVNVWDWKNNLKIASNKVSTKVKGVCFAQDGSYFVTVGNRHVKFWYLEYMRNTKYKEAVPLVGRAAILGSQRGQNFVAVACGRGESADCTYVVTRSGLLCQLNNRRLLDKWLELRTTSASCMSVGEKYIFVGCAEGIVRCFDPITLNFVTTLPRTHHLGVDVSQGTHISHISMHPSNAKYPDTVALTYDEGNSKLTCIYNDHSIYVWDVTEVKRVGKSQSFLYHSACIWGIDVYPTKEEIAKYRNPSPNTDVLPEGCFITCSSDDTVRIWNLNNNSSGNIYSNELIKIIYMDPDLAYIKDHDQTLNGSNDKGESYDGKNGVRCIRIRPDGLHLASGDRSGNIKIHDMRTMKEIFKIEAHDAEVLCLEYSKNTKSSGYPRLLASASRDRLIHIFNVDNNYNILQTLDDHSSSITAVRFITVGEQFKMISCGADKSIIFRSLVRVNSDLEYAFQRDHNVAGRTTLYDMEIDTTGKQILTACQDRTIRVYSTRSGHYLRSIKGSPSEDGSLIKVTLDGSGRYMATSCTDKTLSVYCASSEQLLANVSGHSELATGLKFMQNSERLISASGDASILLWKYRKQKKPLIISSTDENEHFEPASPEIFENNKNMESPDYRFSVGPLPLWAKKQITEETSEFSSLSKSVDLPKGRWAQRVDQSGISVKSVFEVDNIISFPNRNEFTHDSDGSKDSSVDSGTESRNFSDYKKESSTKSKQIYNSNQSLIINRGSNSSTRPNHHPHTDDSSLGSMLGGSSAIGGDTCEDSAAEHDGDVEDCSDVESRNRNTKIQFPEGSLDSPSEYHVNAMSVDELRKSQRKSKKRDLPVISISTTSISGSQESDFDDDDASTPSGDNTDKNATSMLSGSTESIDIIGNQGKYLQSAFDSLSGNEQDIHSRKTTTLSALHHNTNRISSIGIAPRNVPLVNETIQSFNENSNLKKREELNRRIEETRMQLQSVGYKSNLRSSQSVLDLSPIPEKIAKSNSKRTTLYGETKINLDAIQPNTRPIHASNNSYLNINKNDFDIPANINIKNNFKTLPFFTNINPIKCEYQTTPLYDSIINKFNEDMRHLVLQTENGDSFLPTKKIENSTSTSVTSPSKNKENYVTECRKKFELEFGNQSRPNLLNFKPNPSNVRQNSIFKHHKSLPVSPVTEEAKLSDYCRQEESTSSNLDLSSQLAPKNDNYINLSIRSKKQNLSFYVDCGQKSKNLKEINTEKRCYRDEEEDNFSSDSLEEISINSRRIKKYSKTISNNRRCISNYDIFETNNTEDIDNSNYEYLENLPRSSSALLKKVVTYSNESINELNEGQSSMNQNITRSQESILSEPNEDECNIYPEYERHSSASFYLRQSRVPASISQESILSNFSDSADESWRMNEEYCPGEKLSNTNCNSLESILSDESVDTQSAPLEILFRSHRRRRTSETEYEKKDTQNEAAELNYVHRTLKKFEPNPPLMARSKSFHNPPKKNIAYFIGNEVNKNTNETVAHCSTNINLMRKEGNIPSLQSKNDQYEKQANELWSANKIIAKSKSCSFEVNFDIADKPTNKSISIPKRITTNKNISHYNNATKSLDRANSSMTNVEFTTQSLDRNSNPSNGNNKFKRDRGFETLLGDVVKHKPPKGFRRSVSAKIKNRNVKPFDERRNSDSLTQIPHKFTATKQESSFTILDCASDIRSVEMSYYEPEIKTGICESKSAESFLDDYKIPERDDISKASQRYTSNNIDFTQTNTNNEFLSSNIKDSKYLTNEDLTKFRDIERKIEIINKLVEMEEAKLTKGKVKRLSKNFERIAREHRENAMLNNMRVKRNLSLPTIFQHNTDRYDIKSNETFNILKPKLKPLWPPAARCPLNNTLNARIKKFLNTINTDSLDDQKPKLVNLDGSNEPVPTPDVDDSDNGLRRACSLSDLTDPSPAKPKPSKQTTVKSLTKSISRTQALRHSKNSLITRSSSVGVLNQSESESEMNSLNNPVSKMSSRSNLMRPTISSQNKTTNVAKSNLRRRTMQSSYSTANLTSVGQEDSSSDEQPNVKSNKGSGRLRSHSIDHSAGVGGPPWASNQRINRTKELSNSKPKGARNVQLAEKTNSDLPKEVEIDVANSELTTQLCHQIAEQLTRTADSVVQLYKRLTLNSEASSPESTVQPDEVDKSHMLKNLESAMLETQKILQVAVNQQEQGQQKSELINESSGETLNSNYLRELVELNSSGGNNLDHSSMMMMMQQYSDILLKMMQQRMQQQQ